VYLEDDMKNVSMRVVLFYYSFSLIET